MSDSKPMKLEHLDVPPVTSLERNLLIGRPLQAPQISPVPRSNLLAFVKSFLPSLQAANTALAQDIAQGNAEEYDIENVTEEEQHIEMDLACGIFDLSGDCDEAAERALTTAGVWSETSSSSDDSQDDSDEDTSAGEHFDQVQQQPHNAGESQQQPSSNKRAKVQLVQEVTVQQSPRAPDRIKKGKNEL